MRRIALTAALIVGGFSALLASSAVGEDSHTYYVELDNAFGLVSGSEVKVAGVTQGTIEELSINRDKRAVVKVSLAGPLATLGEDTICSSEPQSLIAEYFLDCSPKGAPIESEYEDDDPVNDPDIPVEQTRQTVQNDLVLSGLRQSYRERLTLIINEFGTALAGNPENLNAAIRRGAPALTQARKVTKILGEQNTIIRDLNADSDVIMAKLADRREDVVDFIQEARDTAAASAERRDDLSRNFELLDDFLAELRPTMVELNRAAVSQTPLLRDLRLAGDGLNTLSRNLPDFNAATSDSLEALGGAAVVGRRALNKGSDEIEQLADASKNSFSVADNLAKFFRDIDDPDRAVEVDRRAAVDTDRKNPTGYTGMEGLLNYLYYQPGAVNQFDEVSHLLHFSIFEVESGPCASYNATNKVPSIDGGETTNILEADRCVAWLGPNQPGITDDGGLPPYHPSVCPDGSTDPEICDPNGATKTSGGKSGLERSARDADDVRGGAGAGAGSGLPGLDDLPGLDENDDEGNGGGGGGGKDDDGIRDQLPGGLDDILPDLGNDLQNAPKLGLRSNGDSSAATQDLLGYLFDQ
jgi:ABC-type transporter Mla subunit MlaD